MQYEDDVRVLDARHVRRRNDGRPRPIRSKSADDADEHVRRHRRQPLVDQQERLVVRDRLR